MKKNERAGFWAALEGGQRAPRPLPQELSGIEHAEPAEAHVSRASHPATEPELRQEPRLICLPWRAWQQSPARSQQTQGLPRSSAFSCGIACSGVQPGMPVLEWLFGTNKPQTKVQQAQDASASGADAASSATPASRPPMDKARHLAAACKDWAARVPAPDCRASRSCAISSGAKATERVSACRPSLAQYRAGAA